MLSHLAHAAFLSVPFLGPVQPQRTAPDLILHSGKVVTLASDAHVVEAIAIKDGLVYATGASEDILALSAEDTETIDLGGRTVIPGLNDSHSHVVRGGRFFNLELRWEGVPTLAEGLERIRAQAERTPEGQWVRVIGGWSPYQFSERRMPTITELNEAAPDTPTFVLFLYSQGFLNAAGVKALGITPETTPPVGSRYEFVDGGAILHAEPNPTILYKTIGRLPGLSPDEMLDSTRRYYRELNRFGLTSAVDAGGGGHLYPDDYEATKVLALDGALPLRISFFLFPQRPSKELEDFRDWTSTGTADANLDPVHRGGYVLEGGGEFLVWAAGDFENFMAPRPALREGAEESLYLVARHLVEQRWPFRIHATYGESIDTILDVFDRVGAKAPFGGLRWIIDHAETIRPDQIQRVQRMGGGVAVQNRMAFAGEFFLERYGAEVTAQAPPLRRLYDSGIPMAGGTDATRVSSYNPWVSLYWMVTGKTVGGTVLYPKENRLTRLEALRLFTVGSAWTSGESLVKGALTPGRFADLAVLDRDYLTVPEDEIRRIESVLTITGGRPVYATGPFAGRVEPLGDITPSWSPVAAFGGHWTAPKNNPTTNKPQRSNQEEQAMLQIRRSDDRGHAEHGWLDTYHTFSFADYFDRDYMQFGPLRVLNQDRVAKGRGFGTHGHRDMEIVSYVLDGVMEHKDSMGTGSQMRPGDVQLMSAGSGVTHSEFNGSQDEGLHFLQMWVIPSEGGTKPRYEQRHFSEDERRGSMRLVVSPDGAGGSLTIGQDARMYAGLFGADASARHEVSDGRSAWLHVARGAIRVNGETLTAGDGAAVVESGVLEFDGVEDAEVVLWEVPAEMVRATFSPEGTQSAD